MAWKVGASPVTGDDRAGSGPDRGSQDRPAQGGKRETPRGTASVAVDAAARDLVPLKGKPIKVGSATTQKQPFSDCQYTPTFPVIQDPLG